VPTVKTKDDDALSWKFTQMLDMIKHQTVSTMLSMLPAALC
jgi:hypothetical protein